MPNTVPAQNTFWRLAIGSSSYSRQPTFAPPGAQPSTWTTNYIFGWDPESSSFVEESNSFSWLTDKRTQKIPCDLALAQFILETCSHFKVREMFFKNPYSDEKQHQLFATKDHLFALSLHPRDRDFGRDACATLYFYNADDEFVSISLGNGLTWEFGKTLEQIEGNHEFISDMLQRTV